MDVREWSWGASGNPAYSLIGHPFANVVQDFHLAKRHYDLALETNEEAYLPVIISLIKLHARSLWHTLRGGKNGLNMWNLQEEISRSILRQLALVFDPFYYQLTQDIGMARDANWMQPNSQTAVRQMVIKIFPQTTAKTMDHGIWGRRRKSISASEARIPRGLGKMKIPSRSAFYLCHVSCSHKAYDSGQGIDGTPSKSARMTLVLKITSKALCEGDIAVMRGLTSSTKR